MGGRQGRDRKDHGKLGGPAGGPESRGQVGLRGIYGIPGCPLAGRKKNSPTMKTIVSARRLFKKYGELTAVDGISFDIEEGECFGFLGPNGAGKTSTVRMIHCVSPVTAGMLTVGGLPSGIDNRALKMTTGVIPQEINL